VALCEADHLTESVPTGCDWRGGCPKKPTPGIMPWIGRRRAGILKGKAVSQRQRAKTQGQSLKVAWQDMPWKKVHRRVFHLQKRIYRATQRGDVRTAHKLQKLLVKSWYARLLAVRRVTQDNRGKHTAGMDGVKSLTPPNAWHSPQRFVSMARPHR